MKRYLHSSDGSNGNDSKEMKTKVTHTGRHLQLLLLSFHTPYWQCYKMPSRAVLSYFMICLHNFRCQCASAIFICANSHTIKPS